MVVIWKHGNTEKLISITVQIYSGNKKALKGFPPLNDHKKISYFIARKFDKTWSKLSKAFRQSVIVKLDYSLFKIIHNYGSNVISFLCSFA